VPVQARTSPAVARDTWDALRPAKVWPAWLAVLVAFIVYWRTMAPTVYGLDSAELTTGAYVLGIVHAPGSPLFLLVGHLFTWLPFGDVGYRLNLLSACSAAAALGFVYAIAFRLTGQHLLALATAWLLGSSYYYWVAAIAAELYAPHACFVAALIWLGLRWRDEQRPLHLCLFALVYGLGTGNHLSLTLLTPGLAWLVGSGETRPWRRPGLLVAALACATAGAAVYLYLPLRAQAAPMNFARDVGVDVATWKGFWWMITCRMFSKQLFELGPRQWPWELGKYVHYLWSNFTGLGCALGVIGVVGDWKKRWEVHLALALMFVGHLGFMLTYGVGDKDMMLGPTYLIWSLWIACGAAWVGHQFLDRAEAGMLAAGGLLLLMSLYNVVGNWTYVDISDDWSARTRGEMIFEALSPGATYVGTWADAPILEYLQLVEQQRPDVQVVNFFFTSPSVLSDLLATHTQPGRGLYTSCPDVWSRDAATFQYAADCDCYRLESIEEADASVCPEPYEGVCRER